ncbi:MAG TPA: hypothetical protein VI545_08680 [Burkholderiales bacterium]|nr:hypothetical protein [Burkholderiales bacterium]
MRRYGFMIVWAMAATALPVVAAHAAEATPAAPSPAIESSPSSPAPEPAPSVPMEGLPFDARPAGLTYKADVAAAAPRPDDFRFDFAQRQASEAALRLSPVVSTPRTGWAFSGRVGPLRWLAPIDGEGETRMRLWGRVPGQPRTPGMGHYNISLHYTFE